MKGILLCITITVSIIAITSSFDFNNWDYKNVVVNPYRVLGISPFSSMNKIKKRYRELVKKYHPDKNKGHAEQFRLIQKSFEEIKKKRSDDDSDIDITFGALVKETIKDILLAEFFFALFYGVAYVCYTFSNWTLKFFAYQMISFTFFENVLPHFFNNILEQYAISLIVGLMLYGQNYLFKFIWPFSQKNEKKEEKKD